MAIAVVNLLLVATDDLCAGVVKAATGTDITGLGKLILGTGALTTAVGGAAALLLLSLACIVATVIVYFALVIRKVLIVVTAIFAPLAFAGSLADITVSWTRRWIETTVALIVSKLILILIFVVGYGILIEGVGQAGSGTTQKVTQVISGILVLFLAGFAPWSALKIVHFTGEHAHQLHSLGASTVAGAAVSGANGAEGRPVLLTLRGTGRRRCRRSRGRVRARMGATAGSSGPVTGPGGVPGGKESTGPAGGSVAQGGAADTAAVCSLSGRSPTGPDQLSGRRPTRDVARIPTGGEHVVSTNPGTTPPPLSVRFARRSTRGLLLGFSTPRVAAFGCAAVVAVVALFVGGPMAFVASGLIWLPLGAAAFVRVAGRPAVEWAGTAAHFGARRANGQTEFRARVERPQARWDPRVAGRRRFDAPPCRPGFGGGDDP